MASKFTIAALLLLSSAALLADARRGPKRNHYANLANFVPGKFFDRIVVVPMENTYIQDVLADAAIQGLAQGRCSRLYGRYFGTTHPSLPNYISMVAGSFFGINDDDNHVVSHTSSIDDGDIYNTQTIVDKLDDQSISWSVYVENYPGSVPVSKLEGVPVDPIGCPSATTPGGVCYSPAGCFFGQFADLDSANFDNRLYARKHVPFLSTDSFVYNETRCSLVQHSSQMWIDIKNKQLPQYIFYVPNQCNDGHGTHKQCPNKNNPYDSVRNSSAFMTGFVNKLFNAIGNRERTVVLFVYDENDYNSAHNQVFALAVGCGVVSPAPRFKCPSSGCPYSPSQRQAVLEACYNVTGPYGVYGPYQVSPGAGTDPFCPSLYSVEELASSYSAADGFKADMNPYSHYSIVPLIRDNWGLTDLWQGGDATSPLRLTDYQ